MFTSPSPCNVHDHDYDYDYDYVDEEIATVPVQAVQRSVLA
jgi:hypothetical protein